MRYKNLNELIRKSSSARRYFLSLPVKLQLELHEHNDCIRTSAELHRRVEQLKAYHKQVELSKYYCGTTPHQSF